MGSVQVYLFRTYTYRISKWSDSDITNQLIGHKYLCQFVDVVGCNIN